MSFGLSSLISAKAGLSIVKKALEQTLKQPCENFDIIYKHKEQVIDFRLYNFTDENKVLHEKTVRKYSDGKKLCGIIHNMLKEKITGDEEIQFAVINYKNMTCDLYMLKGEEKINVNYKL